MADKEVRVKIIGDVSDITKKLDNLKKELKDMASTLDKASSGNTFDKTTRGLQDFQSELQDTEKRVEELDDSLEKLDDNSFNKTTQNVKELGEEMKVISDKYFEKMNKQAKEFQDYTKENNTFTSKLKDLFGGMSDKASEFGGKISTSFQSGKDRLLEVVETMNGFQTSTKLGKVEVDKIKESINGLNDKIRESVNRTEKWRRVQEDLNETIEKTTKKLKINEYQQDLAQSQQEIEMLDKEWQDLNETIEKATKKFKNMGSNIKLEERKIASYREEVEKLEKELEEVTGFDKFKQGLDDVFSSIDTGDFSGIIDGLKDSLSGIFQMLPTEAKIAIAGVVAAFKMAEIGINQFKKGIETLGTVWSKISSIARSFGNEIKNAFENLTGFNLDMSSMIETAVNFEDAMVRAGVICGATGEDFEALEQKARELGATTRYSATDVAQAMIEMGQQGYNLEEIMGSVESVLNLATVGNLDLARSAEIVTNTLNAYGLEASEASNVADILAVASTNSGTSVEQLGQALENCASTAGALGISVEDTATAIGLMGDRFIKSGKAGTSLNTFMANMSKPTKAMTDCLAKYNLEGARQKILNGDLIGGYKEFAKQMEGLTNEQKAQIATTIAGKEGMTGFLAIVNSGTEGIEELEEAIENADKVSQHMAETFDNTLKGALSNLSSAIEERLLQVFDKIKEPLMNLINDIRRFFDIWNGFDDEIKGGLASALEWLANKSSEWGKAIAEGLSNIISNIDKFINGNSFDNLLKVGTNIINGIAKGIQQAKEDGSLDRAIEGAIRKIATWCSENLDTIIEVGKTIIDSICEGINENQDLIGEIIQKVIEMQSDFDATVAYEKGRLFGENFGNFILEGIESVLTNLGQYIQGFIESFDWGETLTSWLGNDGESWSGFEGNNGGKKNSEGVWPVFSWLGFGNGQKANEKGQEDGKNYSEGVNKGVKDNGEKVSNTVNDNFKNTKPKTDQTANEIGQGISDGIMKKLETLDAEGLKTLQTELTNTQTTTQNVATAMSTSFETMRNSIRTSFTGITGIVRTQLVNCSNIAKNQCSNMAQSFRTEFVNISNIVKTQMTNVSNTIRTEAVNWSNIIRNQITNARNQFTSQMISMANVARTQMVNVSNVIRTQAVNWSNIVRNQITNARNSFTTQMISMRNVASTQATLIRTVIVEKFMSIQKVINTQISSARNALTSQMISMRKVTETQMSQIVSVVRNYMSQIKALTSQQFTMRFKVDRTITTTNVTKSVQQGMINTMASMNTNMRNVGRPNVMSSTGLSNGTVIDMTNAFGGNLALEVPLILDGREIARASATYNRAELSKLEKRNKRQRGE